MSEIANDMVNGACCSHCGVYFVEKNQNIDHGYPDPHLTIDEDKGGGILL